MPCIRRIDLRLVTARASQIGVLLNATEPGGDSINVLDLTLKFYTSGGLFLGAIDGEQNFLTSNPGNGVAGTTLALLGLGLISASA